MAGTAQPDYIDDLLGLTSSSEPSSANGTGTNIPVVGAEALDSGDSLSGNKSFSDIDSFYGNTTPIGNGVDASAMREDNEIAEMGDMAGANENKSKGSNEGEQKKSAFRRLISIRRKSDPSEALPPSPANGNDKRVPPRDRLPRRGSHGPGTTPPLVDFAGYGSIAYESISMSNSRVKQKESHLETEAIAKKLTDRVGKTLVKAGALTEESASKLQHLVGSVTEYAMKDPTTPVAQPEQTAAERELAAKRAIESLKEDQDVRDAKDGLLSALRTGGSVDGALTLGQIVSLLQKVQEIEGVAKLMKSVEGTSIESGQLLEGNPLDQISVSDIRKLIEDLIERSLGEDETNLIEQGFDLLRELEGNDSFKKLRDLFMRAVKVTGNYIEELRSHANITENSDEKVSMDFINFHKDKIMQGFSGEGEAEYNELYGIFEKEIVPAAQAVMEEVMGLLCEHLPGLKLPNIHGNKKSPVGQICYHLGDMMFQTFNVPPTGIEFITEPLEADGKPSSDPNGIITLVRQTIIIKDIEASMRGLKWQYGKAAFPVISDDGKADVDVKDVSFRISYSIQLEDGHDGVVLCVTSSEVLLPKLDIKIRDESGSASRMYNLLISIINRTLRSKIQQQVASLIMDKIDETSDSLSALSASDLFQVKTSGDLPSKIKHARTLSKSSTSSSNDMLNDQISQAALASKNLDSSQSGASDDESDEKQKFECYHLVKKAVPGVIQDMDSLMGEHFYRSMKGIPKCIFFSKKDEDPPEMLKVLSNQFGNAILFGYVRPQHTRVQKKFGIREEKQEAELPQLVVYPHTSPGGEPLRFSDQLSFGNIQKFLTNFHMMRGKIIPLTKLNYTSLINNPSSSVILVYVFPSTVVPPNLEATALRMAENQKDISFIFTLLSPEETSIRQMVGVENPSECKLIFFPPRSVFSTETTRKIITIPNEIIKEDGVSPKYLNSALELFTIDYKQKVIMLEESINFSRFLSSRPKKVKVILLAQKPGDVPDVFKESWRSFGKKVMHGFVVRSTANESGLKRIYEALGVKKLPALVATFGLQQGRSGSISRSSSRMDFSESSSNRDEDSDDSGDEKASEASFGDQDSDRGSVNDLTELDFSEGWVPDMRVCHLEEELTRKNLLAFVKSFTGRKHALKS